jgi:hypothetical protein
LAISISPDLPAEASTGSGRDQNEEKRLFQSGFISVEACARNAPALAAKDDAFGNSRVGYSQGLFPE